MSGAARVWHAVSAIVSVVALVIQIPITAAAVGGEFDSPAARVANLFTFFTIQTAVLVALTGAALAVAPGRRSTLLSVLRLDAVLGIAVTGIVFHTLLADLYDLRGAEAFADLLFHTVSPVLVVLGWLLFGPRGRIDARVVALSLLYPLLWLGGTLARGAVIGWYPYPFVDVTRLGYPAVLLNTLGITVLFLVLAAALLWLDRSLAGRAGRRDARIGS